MTNKGKTFPVEVLTQEEVYMLMGACGKSRIGTRNRALIAVLYRCGLRISEALDLLPKDVDAARHTVQVLHGKGDKQRLVGIDDGALSELRKWLKIRRELETADADTPIFCTLKGTRIKTSYVRRLLPMLAKKAKIEKRVHAHGLRHTHAYELMVEGVPVSIIQKQLGHSNLATTNRYLDHIAPIDVVNAISQREW